MFTASMLGALFEAAPDAIVGVDADGRIALVNAPMERLFGYGREDLLGIPLATLVPEASRVTHAAQVLRSVRGPEARPTSPVRGLSGRRQDGTEFPAEIALSALETSQGWLILAAVRDISERVEASRTREGLAVEGDRQRAQAQRGQSQRLENLGQLAVGVAHDFNNMLSVILNFSGYVADLLGRPDIGRQDLEEARHDLAQVMLAAERSAVLSKQLLAFGRGGVGTSEVLSLNEVIEGIEQLLRRSLGGHLHLDISLAPGLPLVEADPGEIEQVVVNLAISARDAMPDGGTLRIQTDSIEPDDELLGRYPGLTGGRHLRLRVSDTRAAFPSDQADGLANTREIVTRAGGALVLETSMGGGTTISILLPTARP